MYLKKADNLLTECINGIHSALGLTRLDWQILNSIKESWERNKILSVLSEFASTERLSEAIADLIKRDLVADGPVLQLTSKGKKMFNTCLENQKAFREKSIHNVSEEEYLQMILTLEKLIDNLEDK